MKNPKVKVPYIVDMGAYYDVVIIEKEGHEPYYLLRIAKPTGKVSRYGSIPTSFEFDLDGDGRLQITEDTL